MKKNNEPKSKYNLATATRRIGARILDFIFVSIISIAIVLALVLWIVINKNDYNATLFTGMLTLSIILSFILWFGYFIIIPFFFKGYTLFKKALKIKTHELIDSKKFFLHLIKKELFIWIPFYLILFIFSLVLFKYQDPMNIINSLILFQLKKPSNNEQTILLTIFQFLFILSFVPVFIISIHIMFNSKKRALHDFYSDTCVVYTVPVIDEPIKSFNKKKINVNLPGIIDENELFYE